MLRTSSPTRAGLVLALIATLGLAGGCTQFKRWAYASGDRDSWQQPERVIETLAIAPGDRVADIGSGGGYFTFRLAAAAGQAGRVFAVDVDAAMQEALEQDVAESDADNIEILVAAVDDPGLAPGSVDLVFTSNTYHHIDGRVAYFGRVAKALSERGRVAIIDYKPEGFFQKRHATAADTIRSEMAAAGFALVAEHDYLERQSFLVFETRRAR
jgi:arsenite methyltransferase